MILEQEIGHLSLVGAGPGDPDLITLKATKVLANADVVLYDALANPQILDYANSNAELIYVGKRKGCKAFLQDQIQELIVERALQGKHVVRLKGGDPFVFGRGAEEAEYAAQFGISSTVVPGISSAIAVPALQQIPVTKRHASESVWIITGTTKAHQLSKDVELAAQSTATVVILMGMSKLKQITELFIAENKAQTPIAVIQNGSLPNEQIVVGQINSIVDLVEQNGLTNPAVIIIGEVVAHRQKVQTIFEQFSINQCA